MNRVLKSYDLSSMQEALRLIPEPLVKRIEHVDLCLGVDPVFAGIHEYKDASFGRAYSETAHVAYGLHLKKRPYSDRNTHLIAPINIKPYDFIHEFGHVLHQSIDFENIGLEVTNYAKTNQREAFAETFACWIMKDRWHESWSDWYRRHAGKFEAKMNELLDLG